METWKDIKGFEGYYQVSDLGNVKSLERTKKHLSKNSHVWRDVKVHERILKPCTDASGYAHVRLCKDGKITLKKVHVLVAEAFLDYDVSQYDRTNVNSLVVDHKNRNKIDNRLENLEVVTQLENARRYAECNAKGIPDQTIYINRKYKRRPSEFGQAKIVTISLPEDLVERLDNYKNKKEISSRSMVIFLAVTKFLDEEKI